MTALMKFLDIISRLLVVLALTCLALAALFLMVAHNPDNFSFNYQAETLANFAYALLVGGVIARIFCLVKD